MPGAIAQASLESMAKEIGYEASLDSNDDVGRPLPLASSWMTGDNSADSNWWVASQLERIAQGNYILPVVQNDGNTSKFTAADMQTLADLGLPFSVRVNNIVTRFQQDPYKDGLLAIIF